MTEAVSISVQKRVNTLDVASVVCIVCAILASSSILSVVACLCVCLIIQAIVFRIYFKYIPDNRRMAKRIFFIVGDFVAIIVLLFQNNLV